MRKQRPQSEQLQATRAVFQPRARRVLSDEDCREIKRNMTGFFSVLAQWAAAERKRTENDNARSKAGVEDEHV
jgi:hypothetical protein